MNSFEKLFVNSTNRFSAVKNIILSQNTTSFAPLNFNEYQNSSIQKKNAFILASCNRQEPTETFQQLEKQYQQLSKTIKQANKQQQIMSMLLDKIFKIQEGEDEKLRRRFRRKKNEIQAKFQCKLSNCNKIYSSSASLVRHAKLKHAYASSEPPSHNYQIPPSPNLKHTSQNSNQAHRETNTLEKDGAEDQKEGAASSFLNQEDIYEADCENSVNQSEEKRVEDRNKRMK